MSERRSTSKFSSLFFQIGAVVVSLGVTAVLAVAISLWVFGTLSTSISTMMSEVLPEIETNLEVVQQSGATREAISELALSESEADLEARLQRFRATASALSGGISALQADSVQVLLPLLNELNGNVEQMTQGLSTELVANQQLKAQVEEFYALSSETHGHLVELADTALFDLSLGGGETIDTVQTTLSALTEESFPLMQAVLQARAELNFAMGITVALSSAPNRAFRPILEDLVTSSTDRLARAIDELSTNDVAAAYLEPVLAFQNFLETLIKSRFNTTESTKKQIFELRKDSDAAISELLDTLEFELVILAGDTADENEAAIRNLLENEVSRILEAAEIESAVYELFVAALRGTLVSEASAMDGAQAALAEASVHLDQVVSEAEIDNTLRALLTRIIALADPESGLLRARLDYLEARDFVFAQSRQASLLLGQISSTAQQEGNGAVAAIIAAGNGVVGQANNARTLIGAIGMVSLAILVASLLFTWRFVLQPLGHLTRVTLRLSTGDLAEITGFERVGGEIGRMADALSVFRSGMIDSQEKEKAERARLRAEQDAERQREKDKLQAEQEEALRREREKHEREAQVEAKRRELERAAQEERDARAAELDSVIAGLAMALDKLSSGDLTAKINKEFPNAFEALRLNFNQAVENLSDLIGALTSGAGKVGSSSAEIASSANELASTAERSASSLSETADAVGELEAEAKATSDRALAANHAMADARKQAEASKETVDSAVSTMQEIEVSSEAISKIVDLIDDISFQTNLLALNAGVEAARAGEQGRGFAVVASEVRGLAQRSTEAAREINGLISATRERIEKGASDVSKAGKALIETMGFIRSISESIDEIAVGAKAQSGTITGIRDSISRVQDITQQNVARFEDSLATSEALSTEASTLMELSNRFTTDEGTDTVQAA